MGLGDGVAGDLLGYAFEERVPEVVGVVGVCSRNKNLQSAAKMEASRRTFADAAEGALLGHGDGFGAAALAQALTLRPALAFQIRGGIQWHPFAVYSGQY
jgi:hypothetical protein